MSEIKRDSFVLYAEYEDYFNELSDSDGMKLMKAIFAYKRCGEVKELDGMAKAFFMMIRNNLDRDAQKYAERCEKSQRSAHKRWNANASERMPTHANASEGTQPHANDADNDNDPDPDNDHEDDNVPEYEIPPSSTQSRFEYSPNDNAGAWETVRRKWNEYPVLPTFPRLFMNLFPDEREKFLTMLSAHGVDDLCNAIENYAPVAYDPKKYGTEAKYLYKSLPNFLKAADKYMIAPTPNIADGVEDFTKYNALMQREG